MTLNVNDPNLLIGKTRQEQIEIHRELVRRVMGTRRFDVKNNWGMFDEDQGHPDHVEGEKAA